MIRFAALLPLVVASSSFATHFLGGEIRYTHAMGLVYEIEARMYTCSDSPADRPEITMNFGDGSSAVVPRYATLDDIGLGCCPIRLSTYRTTHVYSGPGTYAISYTDLGRTSGIVNMTNPTAEGVCVRATLIINPVAGNNNSVLFNTPQGETTQNWNTVIHDPLASDPDGDSLSFELVTPLGEDCQPIVSYQMPWAQNLFWIDPATGVLLWDHPPLIGLWSIAIQCTEWRNGMMVGRTTRDMVICVTTIQVGMSEASVAGAFNVRGPDEHGALWISNRTSKLAHATIIGMSGAITAQHPLIDDGQRIPVHDLTVGTYTMLIQGEGIPTSAVRFVVQ